MTAAVGTCNLIKALPAETDAFSAGAAPPMPVTIIGSGFGYLPETLPYVAQNPPYLRIRDDGHSTGGVPWDTDGDPPSSCQVYVANWSDTSISLVINVPIDAYNLYLGTGDYLSPLSDFSPLTLFPNSYNTQSCPVGTNDVVEVTVTNPQSGSGPTSLCVLVGSTGGAESCSSF